jgi:hypothetical protein
MIKIEENQIMKSCKSRKTKILIYAIKTKAF